MSLAASLERQPLSGLDLTDYVSVAARTPTRAVIAEMAEAATACAFVEDAGTIVYGVAVTKEPSCYNTQQTNDAYVGSHGVVTESSPPVFGLRYQTGTGGSANTGAKTKSKTRILPTPRQSTKIDSWASIVE